MLQGPLVEALAGTNGGERPEIRSSWTKVPSVWCSFTTGLLDVERASSAGDGFSYGPVLLLRHVFGLEMLNIYIIIHLIYKNTYVDYINLHYIHVCVTLGIRGSLLVLHL